MHRNSTIGTTAELLIYIVIGNNLNHSRIIYCDIIGLDPRKINRLEPVGELFSTQSTA